MSVRTTFWRSPVVLLYSCGAGRFAEQPPGRPTSGPACLLAGDWRRDVTGFACTRLAVDRATGQAIVAVEAEAETQAAIAADPRNQALTAAEAAVLVAAWNQA